MPNTETPPTISEDEKREAVAALLACINEAEDKTIISCLCADVIKNPNYYASRTSIGKEYFKFQDYKDTKSVGYVRDLWKKVKPLVDDIYDSGKLTAPVRIRLFTDEQRRNLPQHTVEFLRVSPQDQTHGVTAAVDTLWQEMIHAVEVNELLFLYKTHTFAANKLLDGQAELWTGSGEIEAVQLLTEMLAKKQPQLDIGIRRWCDMLQPNLEKKKRCLLLLGSAIGDPNMDLLKDRDGWKELQMFHFEQAKGERCHIRKGRRNAPPAETDLKIRYIDKANSGTDFALVSFFRDTDNGQSIIALQGITTVATLGAARFLCSEKGARDLREGLGEKVDLNKGLPSFEAILSMQVQKGRPGDAHIKEIEPYQKEISQAAPQ